VPDLRDDLRELPDVSSQRVRPTITVKVEHIVAV